MVYVMENLPTPHTTSKHADPLRIRTSRGGSLHDYTRGSAFKDNPARQYVRATVRASMAPLWRCIQMSRFAHIREARRSWAPWLAYVTVALVAILLATGGAK
jgi:hypothetical protein